MNDYEDIVFFKKKIRSVFVVVVPWLSFSDACKAKKDEEYGDTEQSWLLLKVPRNMCPLLY